MHARARQISLDEWAGRYEQLRAGGLVEPWYGGPLSRHVAHGDTRLLHLRLDNSPAALRLWNFLLSEEDRLKEFRASGHKIVGVMKDLGTTPILAFALPKVVAFYPDGAWWLPCVMEMSTALLEASDALGIDESFCPVRAMLGAFVKGCHFPIPDLLTCSVGATCDDFSAIAQRLEALGYRILWWEVPHRRRADKSELAVTLPGGFEAPRSLVDFVGGELTRVRQALEELAGCPLDDAMLTEGIAQANRVRALLRELREVCFTASICPLGALEMLIAEMLAIHFCSDRGECIAVLEELLTEVKRRVAQGQGVLKSDQVRVFWVNPVADIQVMNLLEECGGRICGTDYLFCHALDEIPQDLPPMEALARMALADPMAGAAQDRAARICRDARRWGCQAVVVSRIPGASHCASEGDVIAEAVRSRLGLPVLEIEVPPLSDSIRPSLRTRLEALIETAGRPG